MTDKNDDGLDDLADKLAIMRSPWDHVYHSETGALAALLPKTAKDVDDWERRCLAMHEQQETLKIDAKPRENVLSKITRGD